MEASRLEEIVPVWSLSSVSGGVSTSANIGCREVLVVAVQLILARSATVSLSHQKYGALSTYPIGRYRWKLMRC